MPILQGGNPPHIPGRFAPVPPCHLHHHILHIAQCLAHILPHLR